MRIIALALRHGACHHTGATAPLGAVFKQKIGKPVKVTALHQVANAAAALGFDGVRHGNGVQQLAGGIGRLNRNIGLCLMHVAVNGIDLGIEDLKRHGIVDKVEDDHVVADTAQELGLKLAIHLGAHALANLVIGPVGRDGITNFVALRIDLNLGKADVARKEDDRLREVHGIALAIGQASIFENLQELVHNARRCLLDLVEKNHRERP